MQEMSEQYKSSMKQQFRNRSRIRLEMLVEDSAAKNNAVVDTNSCTEYSHGNLEPAGKVTYATFEKNFIKTDGSMCFMPWDKTSLLDNGYSSKEFNGCIKILFPISITMRGITIDFGAYPPGKISIETDRGLKQYDCTQGVFSTTDTDIFVEITFIKICAVEMREYQRLHIKSIIFGASVEYGNDEITNAVLVDYNSPTCENLPQIDLSVTVTNRNNEYDVENKSSIINFFETGQKVKLYWGQGVDENDTVEWQLFNELECSNWSSTDTRTTLEFVDKLRYKEDNFLIMDNKTYHAFELLELILSSAGITNYKIDESLKKQQVVTPLPLASHRECLQIVANAYLCNIWQGRDGRIYIGQKNRNTDFVMEKSDAIEKIKGVKTEEVKTLQVEYLYYNENSSGQVYSEMITATEENSYIAYFSEPVRYPVIHILDGNGNESTIYSGVLDEYTMYYAKYHVIGQNAGDAINISIHGRTLTPVKNMVERKISNNGATKAWSNPLVNTKEQADRLADWLLANYFCTPIEYDYDYRGYPEIDSLDVITQENDYIEDMKVQIYENKITFNGALGGNIKARRVV